jgi:hypothetical protein
MAAAIIAADRTLRLVIRFLHLDKKAKQRWLLFGSGEAIDRLKGTISSRGINSARGACSALENQLKILNWLLIEKMVSRPHV